MFAIILQQAAIHQPTSSAVAASTYSVSVIVFTALDAECARQRCVQGSGARQVGHVDDMMTRTHGRYTATRHWASSSVKARDQDAGFSHIHVSNMAHDTAKLNPTKDRYSWQNNAADVFEYRIMFEA